MDIIRMMDRERIPWTLWSNNFDLNEKTGNFGDIYEDPQLVQLPSSLKLSSWRRFHEIDSVKPILYDSTDCPDLFSNNGHLFQSEFMKWFCSTLTILNYNHVSEGKRWQGWHHIYNSQINPNGKYIIRLFFMGSWRRFEVDDTVPLNEDNIPLLPRTQNLNELWPMLLAKAALKIASLTSTCNNEIANFNPFLCFTGWPWLCYGTRHLSPKERWKFLTKYTKNCTDLESYQTNMGKNPDLNETIEKPTTKKKSREEKTNTNDLERQQSRVGTTKSDFPIMTLLYFHDIEDDKVSKIPPSYPVYVESTCDVPADPTQIKPPLEGWKLHRWISWAVRQGIINPTEYFSPVRRVLLFNPLKISEPQAQWIDFNELSSHLMDIFFIFKPTFFKFSADISNMIEMKNERTGHIERNEEKTNDNDKKGVKKNGNGGNKKKLNKNIPEDGKNMKKDKTYSKRKSQEQKSSKENVIAQNYFFHFYAEKMSRNEPIYLFVDSLDSKFFLFTFQVYGENVLNFLIIERFDWFGQRSSNETLMIIEAKSVVSKILCLDPGRHVLRIFCQSNNFFYLTISSDTNFTLGNREKIQESMTSESERTKLFAMEVKSKLLEAFNAFGLNNYLIQLRNFYKSYLPPATKKKINKIDSSKIHQILKKEMIETIKKNCLEKNYDDLESSLKIFFMDPNIKTKSLIVQNTKKSNDITPPANNNSVNSLNFHESDGILLINIAATIVQSFFKMLEVKSYLEKHKSTHKDYKFIREKHTEIMNLLTEESMCNLIRNVINSDMNSNWKKHYPCNFDFRNTLNIQKLRGETSAAIDEKWIPIVRKNLFVPRGTVVSATFDLSSNLTDYTVRVFNNDSGKEVERVINNVVSHHYKENDKGFTVLGYARNNDELVQKFEWTLNITTEKGSPQFNLGSGKSFLSVENDTPMLHEVSNIYIPNVHNNIAKVILKSSRSCTLSLRFRTSYHETKVKLKVMDDSGRILKEAAGNSVIFFPVLNLLEDEKEYYINASVMEDSWPLTEAEWQYVQKFKENIENDILQTEESEMSGVTVNKLKGTSRDLIDQSLQDPYWKLQILCESEIEIELKEDRRRTMEILHLKKQLISKDTDRISLGKELRKKFYEENCFEYNDENEESIDITYSLVGETNRTLYPPENESQNLPRMDSVTVLEYRRQFNFDQNSFRKKYENDFIQFERQLERITRHSEMLLANTL